MTSNTMRARTAPGRALAVAVALLAAACGRERPAATSTQQAATAMTCNPFGAHPKHAAASCTTCHACDGVVAFDPAGAASLAGGPAPSFDATTRSCTSVACHGVAPGTFSYWFSDGNGDAVLKTVSYGSAPRPTPSWLETGLGCDGCHGNPPRNGTWHSGQHAGQGPTGAANQCQFCHPDASGANGVGTAITNPALHGNRAVDVQARWRSSCYSCH